MKKMSATGGKTKIFIMILFLGVFGLAKQTFAATYYVCDTGTDCNASSSGWATGNDTSNSCTAKSTPCKTISHGISKMAESDTLIIGDGTYSGVTNTINYQETYVQPKSGTAEAYTMIQAEHDGGATITYTSSAGIFILGNEVYDPAGFSVDSGPSKQNYITIKGLVVYGSTVLVIGSKYVKLINIGSGEAWTGNNSNINIGWSEYCLMEGCYAWGGGRYKFAAFHSHRTILRNCVGRLDYADLSSHAEPIATFSMYSSKNIEVQNCIDVDSDGTYINPDGYWGAFFSPNTSDSAYTGPVNWTNCISLNSKLGFGASDISSGGSQTSSPVFKNCVGWGYALTNGDDLIHSQGNIDIQQCTIGSVTGNPGTGYPWFNCWSSVTNTTLLKNSIVYSWPQTYVKAFYNVDTNDYNDIYASGSSPFSESGSEPTHVIATDPKTHGLLYLPRIESGSSLKTAGSTGGQVGAEIIYQYGKSGTLYGETGYNLLQDGTNSQDTVKLWPYPNEDLIKTKFASYSSHSIVGARGFAAGTSLDGSSQTLTKYIWEYLGNQIPADIYGASSDTTPPAAPTSLAVN
jgi:hypothetical protein